MINLHRQEILHIKERFGEEEKKIREKGLDRDREEVSKHN
jgi:hypothetical protein